jgi:hypothetical protein
MEKQQTAVEWLQNCLNIHLSFEQKMQFEGLFQQAIEMEKQQIFDAWEDGCYSYFTKNSEQYYNETFKK